ncbi:MAG: hypothetical protein AAF215_35815 [Cyanobacteria bacterium P01_A01_bin.123]
MSSHDQLSQRQRLYEEIDRVPSFAVWVILQFAFLVVALVRLAAVFKQNADTGLGCNEDESSVSAAELAGDLAGCVDDGPLDLSTNPSYMKGFGS